MDTEEKIDESVTAEKRELTTAEKESDETKLRIAVAANVVVAIGATVVGYRYGKSKGYPVVGALVGLFPVTWVLNKIVTPIIAPNYEDTWKRLSDPSQDHPSERKVDVTEESIGDTPRENVTVTDIAANLNSNASGYTQERRVSVATMIRNVLSGNTLDRATSNAIAEEANRQANEIQATIPVATGEDARTRERRARFIANRAIYPNATDAEIARLTDFSMNN